MFVWVRPLLCGLVFTRHPCPYVLIYAYFHFYGIRVPEVELLDEEYYIPQFSSVAQSCPTLRPHELQHARPPYLSQTPRVYSSSHPSSQWCHPAISFSIVPFSSCPQSLPASGSFLMSQFFTSGGQSIGVSASASVLPMNTQDWIPLGWTGWISLQSKGPSGVFSNTTVQKHQFIWKRHVHPTVHHSTVYNSQDMEAT